MEVQVCGGPDCRAIIPAGNGLCRECFAQAIAAYGDDPMRDPQPFELALDDAPAAAPASLGGRPSALMSTRQFVASQALAALLANPAERLTPERAATEALRYADCLLAALGRG